MLLMASVTSWGMFACGLMILIFLLLKRSRRYLRRARSEHAKPVSARLPSKSELRLVDAPPEVLRWQVEMHETARDLKAELDTKLGLLQVLIRQAREESSRLEAALGLAERLGLSAAPEALDVIERLPDSAAETALGPIGRLPPDTLNDLSLQQRQRVHALADQGRDAPAIVEQTGLSMGDVELLLSLRVGPRGGM